MHFTLSETLKMSVSVEEELDHTVCHCLYTRFRRLWDQFGSLWTSLSLYVHSHLLHGLSTVICTM
jgi:hypothetical protein